MGDADPKFDIVVGELTGLIHVLDMLRGSAIAAREAVNFSDVGAFPSQAAMAGFASPPKPITLATYPIPPGSSGGGGGQSAGENFADTLDKQRERNRLLAEETALQATLNPLVNDYGFAMEKLAVQQELLSAATAAGLELTPALRASIDELATGYANASVEAARLAETQDQIRQISDDFASAGRSAISGFISDLRDGTDAATALGNAMSSILDSVIDIGLNLLLNGLTGGGGGLLAGLFGSFASGGYTGDGGRNEPAGVVHKGEYVMSKAATSRIGIANLERLHRGYASGGYVGAHGPVSTRPANDNGGALTVHISLDSDLLRAEVTDTAGRVVAQAAPAIFRRANDNAPSAVANKHARFG